MKFSKPFIYFLNWNGCAKRIALIFSILELSLYKHNPYSLGEGGKGGESLKDLVLSPLSQGGRT